MPSLDYGWDGPACTRRQRAHPPPAVLSHQLPACSSTPVLTFVGDGPGSTGGSTQRPGPPQRVGASSGCMLWWPTRGRCSQRAGKDRAGP